MQGVAWMYMYIFMVHSNTTLFLYESQIETWRTFESVVYCIGLYWKLSVASTQISLLTFTPLSKLSRALG